MKIFNQIEWVRPLIFDALLLGSVCGSGRAGASAVFDVTRDFSITSNPNGVWSYGWVSAFGGAFTPLDVLRFGRSDNGLPVPAWMPAGESEPSVCVNNTTNTMISAYGQAILPPGTVMFYPGWQGKPQNYGVIRFTVPSDKAGTYLLETAVAPVADGSWQGDTDFHVVRGSNELFGQFLAPTNGVGYTNQMVLSAGDTIDFAIGRGADGKADGSGLRLAAQLTCLTNTSPPLPPPPTETQLDSYDLSQSFPVTNNPSGPWTYGWFSALGGSFTQMTVLVFGRSDNGYSVPTWQGAPEGLPTVQCNNTSNTMTSAYGQAVLPPRTVWYFPGIEGKVQNYGVVRFKVPVGKSGIYRIQTAVAPIANGSWQGDTDYHVMQGTNELFGKFLGRTDTAGYTNAVALADGAAIDFAIGRGADGKVSGSGLRLVATLTCLTNMPVEPPPVEPPPPTEPAADYDLSRDFSIAQNPASGWSYGWLSEFGGSFTLLDMVRFGQSDNGLPVPTWMQASDSLPAVEFNNTSQTMISADGQAILPPGTVWYYPGWQNKAQSFGVIRFTVPSGKTGTYLLKTAVDPIANGPWQGDTDFHVVQGNTELFGRFLSSADSAGYTNLISLNAGDSLDLAVGRGADGRANGSGLRLKATLTWVTNTPPPPPPPPPVLTDTYDLGREFSTSNNPSGAWSYGWLADFGGPFTLLQAGQPGRSDNGLAVPNWVAASNSLPAVMFNNTSQTMISAFGQAVLPPGTVWFYPGWQGKPENYGVIRFTVPSGKTGNYRLEAAVAPMSSGSWQGDTDFHVVQGSNELFGHYLSPTDYAGYTNIISLNEGDAIDFAIGRGVDGKVEGSGLRLQASLTWVTNAPPPPPPPPEIGSESHDLAREFSIRSNPAAAWSYGWVSQVGGSFTALDVVRYGWSDNGLPVPTWTPANASLPAVCVNNTTHTLISAYGQADLPPGTVWFYPGWQGQPQNYGMIRFTVPIGKTGTYRLETAVAPVADGSWQGDTDFHVLHGSTELFGQFLAPTDSVGYTNLISLSAGDSIDFAIGRGADGLADGSGLRVTASFTWVTNTPPPPPPPPETQPDSYQLAQGFSSSLNPNGVWSYGWVSEFGGSFTLLQAGASGQSDNGLPVPNWLAAPGTLPGVYFNSSSNTMLSAYGHAVLPPGTMWFYAGQQGKPQNYGVIRFSVPTGNAGTYRVESAVAPVANGSWQGDTDFHVLRSGTELFGQFLSPTNGTSYSNLVALAESDTIDFAIGRGADGKVDGSGLRIAASLTWVTNDAPPPPPPPPPAQTNFYDVAKDLSISNNPSGPWSCGWMSEVGGTFTLLEAGQPGRSDNGLAVPNWAAASNSLPTVEFNNTSQTMLSAYGQAILPPGTVWFFPGWEGQPQNLGVIRFAVPNGKSGLYRIETAVGSVANGSWQGDTDFHVVQGTNELFGQWLSPTDSAGYTNVLQLREGDMIDFAIGRGTDGLANGSGLRIAARLIPVTAETPGSAPLVKGAARSFIMRTLRQPRLNANGSFQFSFAPGPACLLEYSTDLVNWHPLMVVPSRFDPKPIIDGSAATASRRFYRVRPAQ